jgi:Dolichyl-phosphate-mannose-protein mannosyltransferase
VNPIGKALRGDGVFLVVVIVLGGALRALSLHAGLWRDEGSTYFDVTQPFPMGVIATVGKSELSPPGFFLLMALWVLVFGTGELALKFPAFLFGLALVPATYVLARQCTQGLTAARVAAGFAAFAPAAIYYSQDARAYTLAALLCCIAASLYLEANRSDRPWTFVALGVALTAFAYTQYTGLVFVVALLVASAYSLTVGRKIGSPAYYLLVFAAVGVLALVLLPQILFGLHVGNPWKPVASGAVAGFAHTAVANMLAALPVDVPFWRTGLQLGLFGILGILAAFDFFGSNRTSAALRGALCRPVAALAVAFVCAALFEAAQDARVMFAFAPLGWVCVAFWVASLASRVRARLASNPNALRAAWVAAAVLALIFVEVEGVAALRFDGAANASGIRPFLAAGASADTLYVIAPDFMAPTFGYYARNTHDVAEHGFAQWEHPEYIDLAGMVAGWNAPSLDADTEARIAATRRLRYLDLVIADEAWGLHDTARLPLSRTAQLLHDLRRRYRFVDSHAFEGREEPIVVYRFVLNP